MRTDLTMVGRGANKKITHGEEQTKKSPTVEIKQKIIHGGEQTENRPQWRANKKYHPQWSANKKYHQR